MTKEEKIFFIYIYLYIVWKKGKVRKEDIYKNNKKKTYKHSISQKALMEILAVKLYKAKQEGKQSKETKQN